MDRSQSNADKLTKTLLLIYLIVMGWVILLKLGVRFSYMEDRKVNLIPFANGYYSIIETILNVVIFIPLGIYVGILLRNSGFGMKLLFFFFTSLLLEGLQYVFKFGIFDITDLMTNTTGAIIGYLHLLLLQKLSTDPLKTHKFINVISVFGTFLIILLLILLKMNLLPIKYQ